MNPARPGTDLEAVQATSGASPSIGSAALTLIQPDPAGPGIGDRPSELVELAIQRRHSRNVWSHFARDVGRVLVLVAADLAVYWLLRQVIRETRTGLLGLDLAQWAGWAFPSGFLGGLRFPGALILSLAIVGSYGSGDARRDGSKLLGGTALATLIALYGGIWAGEFFPTVLRGLAVIAVFSTGLGASRTLVHWAVWRVRPRVAVARAIVVAHTDADWRDLARLLRRIRDLVVVGNVTLDTSRRAGAGVHPRLKSLGHDIHECRAETVLLWGQLTEEEFAYAVDVALATGCRLLAGARTAVGGVEPRGVWIGGRQLVELTPPSLSAWQMVLKRGLDVAGSALGLILLAPVLLAAAVVVLLDSGWPVVFVQRRVGAKGQLFRCFKFRSMRRDAEQVLRANPELYAKYLANHYKLPESEDPRLTGVGRFLRKTSLDELPQLLNVLAGHMSLVGPRPIVPAELDHYGFESAMVFMSLKPGITGAWAVSGRSAVGYPDRANMELEYIRRWSLISDVGILLRTVPAVLHRRGAH